MTPRIDVLAHLGWAAAIAIRVARSFRFERYSPESDDVIQVAHLTLCKKANSPRFRECECEGEKNYLFRGWASRAIEGECRREARRLKNAGTYNTRREASDVPAVEKVYLSDLETPGGDGIPLVDYRGVPTLVDEVVDIPPRNDVATMARLFARK